MPYFFSEHPILAWMVAPFIVLTGIVSIPRLSVAWCPVVAPPGMIISVSYPGVSPDVINTSVVSLIEREISGVDNLLYFTSSRDTPGMASMTVAFKPGADIKLAQREWLDPMKSAVSGAHLTLADVARVASGLQRDAFGSRENGVPATAAAIQLSPGANAINTASGIRSRLTELSGVLREGMTYTVPVDTAPFVKLSTLKNVMKNVIRRLRFLLTDTILGEAPQLLEKFAQLRDIGKQISIDDEIRLSLGAS